jgi:hypothetical protein
MLPSVLASAKQFGAGLLTAGAANMLRRRRIRAIRATTPTQNGTNPRKPFRTWKIFISRCRASIFVPKPDSRDEAPLGAIQVGIISDRLAWASCGEDRSRDSSHITVDSFRTTSKGSRLLELQ